MRVLILGGDGYLGWPTAMMFAAGGHQVIVVDNYLRRTLALETDSLPLILTPPLPERARIFAERTGLTIDTIIADLSDSSVVDDLFERFHPETVVHYAEQPSAPYSMRDARSARLTLNNNLNVTFNVIWGVLKHAPDCHIIKLGTMGEYGTPEIDIEEGFLEIAHKGRKDTFLFPRAAGSLYHTTKVLDTDLLWFYVRLYGLRVTDLMQGPVYGLSTPEADLAPELTPNFHYDDIFGTVVNRFLVQAVANVPLTIYGAGEQTRGYLNLIDSLQCVRLAAENPPPEGSMRIMNQFTELFSVNQLAALVMEAAAELGIYATTESIPNPRKEKEKHYYNAHYTKLLDLGLKPHFMTKDVLTRVLGRLLVHRDQIDLRKIGPRVRWSSKSDRVQ